jgi:uncharacterized repeat protein (TIGR03803 family)
MRKTHVKNKVLKSISGISIRRVGLALALLLPSILVAQAAPSSHFKLLYSFKGGTDGAFPYGGALIRDAAGNLYGTTNTGGRYGAGVVFKLNKAGKETVLYSFTGGADGAQPEAGLIRDAAGNLYGTTNTGGRYGAGVVFKLNKAGKETVLHSFDNGTGGGFPLYAGLIRDAAGNLYGTTSTGGRKSDLCTLLGTGCGVVFKLDKAGKETVLYSFAGGADGFIPTGLIRDTAGNLYGTTFRGGDLSCTLVHRTGCGVVFKLDKAGKETVLYSFTGGADGAVPTAGVTWDAAGNLYGTTQDGGDLSCAPGGGEGGCGVVFELNKAGKETVLYTFEDGTNGASPYYGGVIRDTVGNLYGTALLGGDSSCYGGLGCGVVYELNKAGKETVLYTFTGYPNGVWDYSSVIPDPAGNLYGTTARGGDLSGCDGHGCGMVYMVTP